MIGILFIISFALADKYRTGTKIPLQLTGSGCHIMEFQLSYKPLHLEISPSDDDNRNKIMSYVVTDVLDYSCLRSCPENSVYCTSAGSGVPSVPHLTEQVEVCLDHLYVYIAYQSDFAISVSTDFVGDLTCEGIDRDLKNYCMMVPND